MSKLLDDNIMILIEFNLNKSNKRHILVIHDELIFYANDSKKIFQRSTEHQPLHKKGLGLNLYVSDFLTEIKDQLKFEQDEACIIMKSDINYDGW